MMLGVNACNNLLFPPVAALEIASVASTMLPGLPPVAVAVLLASTLLGFRHIRFNPYSRKKAALFSAHWRYAS